MIKHVISFLCILITNNIYGQTSIEVSLFNNPKAELYIELPYKTLDIKSGPMLLVTIPKAERKVYNFASIKIFDEKSTLLFTTNIEKSQLEKKYIEIDTKEVLKNPSKLELSLTDLTNKIIKREYKIEMKKLYGSVTDFDGKPIKGAWVTFLSDPNSVVGLTNDKGEYELFAPVGNYNCIAAITKQYPFSQLENYLWNVPLTSDLRQDFKIGSVEIFKLMASAMPQNRAISGSFITWSSSTIKKWAATKTTPKYEMGMDLLDEKYVPDLKPEHVKFFLDDIEIKNVPLFYKADTVMGGQRIKNYAYNFEFMIPNEVKFAKYHTLKVYIEYPSKNEAGEAIIEKGQGSLHNIEIYVK